MSYNLIVILTDGFQYSVVYNSEDEFEFVGESRQRERKNARGSATKV